MAGSILQADMATVGTWLRQGWRWWTGQLAGLVPERLRVRPTPLLLSRTGDAAVPWRLTGRRGPVALATVSARQARSAVLALAPADVLCRIIDAPALGTAELRQMVAFDIDRLTPFSADQACFDVEVLERAGDGGTVKARVGVMPADRARALLEEVRAIGFDPAAISLLDEDGRTHFDFRRALGETRGSTGLTARWWIVVAALFALNIAAMIWRDVAQTEALRTAVEENAVPGRTALALRQRIDREQTRRLMLVRARERREPLRIINAVTRTLPTGAWVQRLQIEDGLVRIAGYRRADVDVVEALRTDPIFADVRENDAEAATGAIDTAVSYDVSASLARGGAR